MKYTVIEKDSDIVATGNNKAKRRLWKRKQY